MPKVKSSMKDKIKLWLGNNLDTNFNLLLQPKTMSYSAKCVEKFSDFTRFCTHLCRTFTAANITWNKVSCPEFKNFIHKYTLRHLASESTLRKNYLPKDYDMVIKQIRNSIGNNNIRISVDETTDRLGRYIAHLVIGKLSSEEAGRPFLLALKQLDKTNSTTISRFINESLALLWPKGTEHKKVKWFLSDGASYMIKTGTNLKVLYENITHLTCMALG
ncbi:hypothetical protein Zmor_018953 [Zophobas morio]|uniref:DUF659 domain-containing protein n=1 Tax=Zophobas morio TaxID=2755281 RepID=A0AA38IC88_9CUCU|nr:hypothetical protein Zmor_018953 [Zophobas morio]